MHHKKVKFLPTKVIKHETRITCWTRFKESPRKNIIGKEKYLKSKKSQEKIIKEIAKT